MNDQLTRIDGLFRRNQSLDLASIEKVAGGHRRRSLFRDLDGLGCLTSYTHAPGRYYTLSDIPQFDEHGLWFCKGIGFSRAGTLKNTLVELIGDAEAGYTHHELRALMHIRVHNTLLSLVHDKRVNREHIEKLYVYVSVQRERAQAQVTRRGECLAAGAKADLFRRTGVRQKLRDLTRELGRELGAGIDDARQAVRTWQSLAEAGHRIPSGREGIAVVRAMTPVWKVIGRGDSAAD
jgi:hypothetical protein